MTYTIEDLQELHDKYGYFEIVAPYQSPDNTDIFQEEWHLFVGFGGGLITGATLEECLDKYLGRYYGPTT
jgi:hypothetical protein